MCSVGKTVTGFNSAKSPCPENRSNMQLNHRIHNASDSWRLATVMVVALISSAGGAEEPLRLIEAIPLPKVSGRIDPMAAGQVRKRLVIAALGNNTLELVNL